ncbi:hypothetical protein B0T10DRAFT_550072 [Thelonectria olida]|uniref:Lysine-specific metallo-endopeptidase domain-containing protein n=1 Tax=Thelonectria olida TaxID=1576542 RepID=A0A9P8VZQ3_9HYPO|nr:hypothetical protein B0T10DRAFT_550072 [Thelonectria olida]
MQTTMLRVLLCFLSIGQCLAVIPWKPIGCDDWSFQGKTIQDIWDNAIELATQAQSQIDLIPTTFSLKHSEAEKLSGANAHFMFNVNFRDHRGLDEAGQTTMSTVRTMYTDILKGFAGTLKGLDVEDSFLFCGANGLEHTVVPGLLDTPVWHARFEHRDENDPENVKTEYLILRYASSVDYPEPCTEVTEIYTGKTLDVVRFVDNNDREFTGIILCPNVFAEATVNGEPRPIPVVPTLAKGFATEKKGSNKYPYAGDYNSISGTLLHEMTHVVGRFRDKMKYPDPATGFQEGNELAKKDLAAALINPDTYRVFSEISMSPNTRWGMPDE